MISHDYSSLSSKTMHGFDLSSRLDQAYEEISIKFASMSSRLDHAYEEISIEFSSCISLPLIVIQYFYH